MYFILFILDASMTEELVLMSSVSRFGPVFFSFSCISVRQYVPVCVYIYQRPYVYVDVEVRSGIFV